jgi:helicase MOV-10
MHSYTHTHIHVHRSMHTMVAGCKNQRFNMRFTIKRLPFRVQHQGIALAKQLDVRVLYPIPQTLSLRGIPHINIPHTGLSLINRTLNEEQQLAVTSMLTSPVLHAPYVLFGPPGTGKTVTLVEYVAQVVRLSHGRKRVLVCAASNAAADVIAKRLQTTLGKSEMLRLYSDSRSFNDVPESLREYCNWDAHAESFYTPPVEQLHLNAVVVCTCFAGGRLYNKGVRPGHFECIVIDEAGHATEPELLAAIGGHLAPNSRVIIAGDHQQLGPVVFSSMVQKWLSVSLLERLMHREVYLPDADGEYDSRVVTMLKKNYRCVRVCLCMYACMCACVCVCIFRTPTENMTRVWSLC